MNQVVTDIWPYLMPCLLGFIVWQWKENHGVKIRVAVLEKTIDDVQTNVKKDIENIQKTIENMQKRQDSHSKKQDEILKLMTDMKLEIVREVSTISTEVKAINRVLSINDEGIKFKKK